MARLSVKHQSDDEDEEIIGLIEHAKELILYPVQLITSPTARRAYLRSFLSFVAASILLALAAIAYIFFYNSYIPIRGFTLPVHLEFDSSPPSSAIAAASSRPHGTVSLGGNLIHNQRYDVHVLLDLPRTKANRAAGNFMLDLSLLGPVNSGVGAAATVLGALTGEDVASGSDVIARARRPGTLTYYSMVMEAVHRALQIPWYVLGWRREAEMVKVVMMEGVEFGRGAGWSKGVPERARLELRSEKRLQVYNVQMVFTAKFAGLRWIMYNHRIISFLVFTTLFWLAEIVSAAVGWLVLSYFVLSPSTKSTLSNAQVKAEVTNPTKTIKSEGASANENDQDVAIKSEGEEDGAGDADNMSDTERSFPTFSRQPPLRYTSPTSGAAVKKEEGAGETRLADIPAVATGADADDEDDEDADFVLEDGGAAAAAAGYAYGGGGPLHSDSGIGTSMESSAGKKDPLRRRRSGGAGGGGRGRED